MTKRAYFLSFFTVILMSIIISDNALANVQHDDGLFNQLISEVDSESESESLEIQFPEFKPTLILQLYTHLDDSHELTNLGEINRTLNRSPHGWAVPIFLDHEVFRL